MLEGVAVIADVIIIVVGVSEEIALSGKDIGRTQVDFWQENLLRVFHFEYFFRIVFQVLAVFVA